MRSLLNEEAVSVSLVEESVSVKESVIVFSFIDVDSSFA